MLTNTDIYPLIISYLPQCHMLSRRYNVMAKSNRGMLIKLREKLRVFVDMICEGYYGFVPTFNFWVRDGLVYIETDRYLLRYIQHTPTWSITNLDEYSVCEEDEGHGTDEYLPRSYFDY